MKSKLIKFVWNKYVLKAAKIVPLLTKTVKYRCLFFNILYECMLCRNTHRKLRCKTLAFNSKDSYLKAKGGVD